MRKHCGGFSGVGVNALVVLYRGATGYRSSLITIQIVIL